MLLPYKNSARIAIALVLLPACGMLKPDRNSRPSHHANETGHNEDEQLAQDKGNPDDGKATGKAAPESLPVYVGSWRANQILCGSEDSAILGKEAIGAGAILNEIEFSSATTGTRLVVAGGCQIEARFENVTMGTGNVLTARDRITECREITTGGCIPYASQCPPNVPADLPFKLYKTTYVSNDIMHVEMEELKGAGVCASGQDQTVTIVYERKS